MSSLFNGLKTTNPRQERGFVYTLYDRMVWLADGHVLFNGNRLFDQALLHEREPDFEGQV